MKKKNSKLLLVVAILLIIFGTMVYFYLKPSEVADDTSSNIREVTVGTGTIEKTITGSRRDIIKFNREIRA